tara:strand:- start:468 stop:1679 length:1212 start_codon:yes stop_codon:yes gene_type:complete
MKQNTRIEMIKVEDLIPYAKNSRTHTAEQVAQIAGSIKEFGFTNPVLIDADNGIIAGHGRVLAAQKLGRKNVPSLRLSHLSETQKRAYIIADNKLAMNAGWDDEMLSLEIKDLKDLDFDISLTGFDELEVSNLLRDVTEGKTDPDEVPEPPEEPVTNPGDLWLLGDHRLLCGDSTSADDVAKLMDGHKADLCFTSPPYALGSSCRKEQAYIAHEDTPKGWPELMHGWWSAFEKLADCFVVNVQLLGGNKRELLRWIADRSERLVDVAIWNKVNSQPAMQGGVLNSMFELLLILGQEEATRIVPFSSWRGTVNNIYSGPPQRSNDFSKQHAATMPTHLVEWIFGTLCDQAKTVVDPFAGTGTTAIVAEQMGRRSFGMEIDPRYCDIVVRRWEDFTGKKAVREGS